MATPIIADGDRNMLDSVLLSERTVARWHEAARALLAERMLDPATIANEDAEVLPDCQLRMFCTTTAGEMLAEITIPASEWTWAPRGLN